jgi:magnesium-transporting ATPase (P-type)
MDVLAAIALATEAPHPTQLSKDRIKKASQFVLPIMWRQIFSQVLYQAVVMIILLYFGPMMFGIEYNLVQQLPFYVTLPDGTVHSTVRLQHLTLLFQTFVLMNLFNMFNCRKIGSENEPQLNVFESLHHNWWFLIILLTELNV